MKITSIREELSEVSMYSQVNKPFRHAYGASAAAVLETLLYKYEYWGTIGKLVEVNTKGGGILHKFFVSKLDIALDSGVSISMLEKKDEKNPLILLENLGLIKIIKRTKLTKSNNYVLYPKRILNKIKTLTQNYNEDMAMVKGLYQPFKIKFIKALKGKLSREEVYEKFKVYYEEEELLDDDQPLKIKNSTPIEIPPPLNKDKYPPIEGISNNTIKNKAKKGVSKNTEPNPPCPTKNQVDLFQKLVNEKEITIDVVGNGIRAYSSKNITAKELFEILKRFIPDKQGLKWKMNEDDESYIKQNLNGMEDEYLRATLIYIENNIKKMINGKRKMRFGSMLAGIRERIIEAGIGWEDLRPKMSKKEYIKMINELPECENFDYLDDILVGE